MIGKDFWEDGYGAKSFPWDCKGGRSYGDNRSKLACLETWASLGRGAAVRGVVAGDQRSLDQESGDPGFWSLICWSL